VSAQNHHHRRRSHNGTKGKDQTRPEQFIQGEERLNSRNR